jgi:FKBP-type peptidyl-prolyl cis-trans isomerase (trigger factor)
MEKIMKKILATLLAITLLILPLASCNKDKGEGNEADGGENNGQIDQEKEPEIELPGVDFLNEDLSEYVEIDEKWYKGFTVEVDPGRVSDLEVNNEIIKILCKYKSEEPVEGDGVISVGDIVHIYYKGYYMKDGEPYFFQGGDNTSSASAYKLEIGSGSFIPGFEYNLIGKDPANYNEENPLVVESFFPKDYKNSPELAGKTAYFIVTVEKIEEYDCPELDDAFITETLKMSESDLSAYAGENLSEKFTTYIKELMFEENGLDVETLIMEAFWKSVMEGAVVKKYPEKQLKEAYDTLIAELEYYYNYYSAYYEYEEFMCLYIGLEVGSDWRAYVTDVAKSQIKQQLVFYHIMNVEGLKPSLEEYAALFDEYLVSALENSGITPDKYSTEEEYLAAKESYKVELFRKNGEDYFKSMIYYQVTVKAIKGYANVVEIAK